MITLCCIWLFLAMGSYAQQPAYFDVKLWEAGLPNSNGQDDGGYGLHDEHYKPVMRVFLPAKNKATGRAIVCFPGGGYAQTQPEHYGEDWAPFYQEQGIAFIALHYRVPHGQTEVPISDAIEAYQQTKRHAAEWGINPHDIGIQGVSAGGHLATTLTTHFQDSLQVAFQILIYPVITFEDPYVHSGSRDNLIGKQPSLAEEQADYKARRAYYSNEKHVSRKTPRAFIAASDDDRLLMNSVLFYQALHEQNVPSVIHTYPSGGHGWHINLPNNPFKFSGQVEAELKAWLSSF